MKIERMIAGFAKRLARRGRALADEDDMMQIGRIAAMEASRRFAPGRAARSSFLAHRVRGAMIDELRRVSPFARSYFARLKERGTVPRFASFETWVRGKDDEDGRNDLPDRSFTPAPAVDLADFWARETRGLTPDERAVVLGYARDGKTMNALGCEIGFSESRVSQLYAGALRFMKRTLRRIPAEELLP